MFLAYRFTISLFVCGLMLYHNEKNCLSVFKSEQTTFQGTLSDYPQEKGNSIMLTLKLSKKITPESAVAVKGSIILYNKKDNSLQPYLPGDILNIKCTPIEISNRGNPYEFDYRFYMENHDIKYYAFTSGKNILCHSSPVRRKLIYKALIVREKIIGIYKQSGITGDNLALVAAVTLGQKSLLDQEQKQNFIRAGVMHIMAVSGLHAVILSLFVLNLLFFLRHRLNIVRIIFAIIILWGFAFVTGLTPSVMRAAFMFTFIQAGNMMHRRVNSINSVLASAFVLILIRPSVIFDAGFLLSYSAVIYIISFYQDLYSKLHFKKWLTDKIWQSAVITLVAQAGTLPLTIMLFNRFPTCFILTNIIIVPLSSVLIVSGFILPLVFPIKIIAGVAAVFINHLAGLTELITAKVSSLPWSGIENIGMLPVECFLLFITIFLIGSYILKKRPVSVFYPIAVLSLFVIDGTVKEINVRSTNQLIVYNTPGTTTIGVRTGSRINIYSDTSAISPDVKRHCATLGLKPRLYSFYNKSSYLAVGGRKILISDSLNQRSFKISPLI